MCTFVSKVTNCDYSSKYEDMLTDLYCTNRLNVLLHSVMEPDQAVHWHKDASCISQEMGLIHIFKKGNVNR